MINVELLKEYALEFLWAFVSSLGFSLLFSLKGKKLFWASLGGAISWLAYVSIGRLSGDNLFLCGVISSMIATAYAETFARILKTPKTAFVFTGIIPMVPGGGLYYTMSNLITKKYAVALKYAYSTFVTAIALAFGIVVVILWVKAIKYIRAKNKTTS